MIVISLLGQISPTKGSILKMLSWNKNKSSSIAFLIVLYFRLKASSALFLLLSKYYLGSISSYDDESFISCLSSSFSSWLLITSLKSINCSAYSSWSWWQSNYFFGLSSFSEENALHSKFTFTFDLFTICRVCCDWSPI